MAALKEERQKVSDQLRNEGGFMSDNFKVLFEKAEKLDNQIQRIENSIKPDQGHGTTAQDTLRSSRGPEDRKKS